MADYTISAVSSQAPEAWSFTDQRTGSQVAMETYKVKFGGMDDAIAVTRKPGNTPKVGELLSGRIEDFRGNKQFKADRKPFTSGQSKDSNEIKAQFAIKAAIAYLTALHSPETITITDVEPLAKDFFAMVERVKNSGAVTAVFGSAEKEIEEGF